MIFSNTQYYTLWQIVIFIENLLPEFNKSNTPRKLEEYVVLVAVTGFTKACPIISFGPYEMIGQTTCLSIDIPVGTLPVHLLHRTGVFHKTWLGLFCQNY